MTPDEGQGTHPAQGPRIIQTAASDTMKSQKAHLSSNLLNAVRRLSEPGISVVSERFGIGPGASHWAAAVFPSGTNSGGHNEFHLYTLS